MKSTFVITLLGTERADLSPGPISEALKSAALDIDSTRTLASAGDFRCLELVVSTAAASTGSPVELAGLRKILTPATQAQGLDVAVQTERVARLPKRLIVFDMDSTFIQCEVIDELAREQGVYAEVAAVTEEAMRGNLDFDESLRRRCSKLRGLTAEAMEKVRSRVLLTPGAEEVVRVLRSQGCKTALLSGGFTFVAEHLKERLNLDYVHANRLEIANGALTGNVFPPIVNARCKAALLEQIAQENGIPLEQVVAVGDGANDLLMLEKAGLGIAFNAKPAVREKAQVSLTLPSLLPILFLCGNDYPG